MFIIQATQYILFTYVIGTVLEISTSISTYALENIRKPRHVYSIIGMVELISSSH